MVLNGLKNKVSASSLIEVITSMVIISIVFSLTLMIFMNVQEQMDSQIKTKARTQVRNLAIQHITANQFKDETVAYEDFSIKCTINPFPSNGKLSVLHLEAYTMDNKMLYKYRRLIQKK
jgi:Tfp pilus assembly protein PilV